MLLSKQPERSLAFSGSLLFAIGLITGIYSAAALTGTIVLVIPRLALAAHLNALLGGIWLLVVSYSLKFLNYDEAQKGKLALLSIIPAWFNWIITLVASFLGVNGLSYTSDPKNNVIAAMLQVLVVLPALFSSLYWVRGFFSKN